MNTNHTNFTQAVQIARISGQHEEASLWLTVGRRDPAQFNQQVAALKASAAAELPMPYGLWGAWRGERLVGSLLYQLHPGRTAMVWPVALVENEPTATAEQLLLSFSEQIAGTNVQIVQALISSELPGDIAPLLASGFRHVSDLLFLVCQREDFSSVNPCPRLDFEPYSPAAHARMARLIEASYQGSLDCPAVNGIRDTEDVMLGYRATGRFSPANWLIVRHGPIDIGCLILTEHPSSKTSELIYMGVAPDARGHNWGTSIARYAQWHSGQAGQTRLVLAVDAVNEPALRMYAAAGFRAWDRRSVLLKIVGVG